MDDTFSDDKKGHRQAKSGRKAEKKKSKKLKEEEQKTPADGAEGVKKSKFREQDARKRNPKAFAIQNVAKAEKLLKKTADKIEKKTHMPAVDRTPTEPPPFVVAVVGPPNSGKSTLIKCLVRNFTRQNMSTIKGPVTVVSGKQRRVTLIECVNDINVMIDIAKVADLALLTVDASYGFEMDTFEFLNICQVHGFPRIMGVLTHLDCITNAKTLKKTKKVLKHRFWTEIYQGAKLFYLSKFIKGGYLRTEIKNLGRFISVMKFRPLVWRTQHPYVLVDRMEDITDEETLRESPVCNRRVLLFGYGRGTFFRDNQDVHVPGVGDFTVENVSFIPDPCPIPGSRKVTTTSSGDTKTTRRKSLTEKDKLLYAPMSGVGGLVYDKDAVYIDLKGSHSHDQERETDEPEDAIVNDLLHQGQPISEKLQQDLSVQLFSNSQENVYTTEDSDDEESDDDDFEEEDFEENDEEESDDEEEEMDDDGELEPKSNNRDSITRRRVHFENLPHERDGDQEVLAFDDDDEDNEEDLFRRGMSWKADLNTKAAESFYDRLASIDNIQAFVYGDSFALKDDGDCQVGEQSDDSEDESSEGFTTLSGGLFTVRKKKSGNLSAGMTNTINSIEMTKFPENSDRDWTNDSILELIRDSFVTGKWDESEDAAALLKMSEEQGGEDDDTFGDFEDLETGEKHEGNAKNPDVTNQDDDEDEQQRRRIEKKRKLKTLFDMSYDDKTTGGKNFVDELRQEVEEQSRLNREEFQDLPDETRVKFEGFRPGMYLRIEIDNVPCEFVEHFNPDYPIIVGGLASGETSVGYSRVRIKRHRWYKRILKSRDPLILSLGWRRFQTLAIFSIEDYNGRNRLLKYTPRHLHCHATFWGPIAPQGSGILALQSVSDEGRDVRDFRIAGTGVVLNLDRSMTIVKKLKLIGAPVKIYKKTAFIKGMFTSALEVTKFEGATVKTVSGIRGQIKKAIRAPTGAFRATFEDKILLSDIVFMRTWFTISIPKFYVIVRDLLLPNEERVKWTGMKTVGQLRHEQGVKAEYKKDSIYRPVERKVFNLKPLFIPAKLQAKLPYSAKPKFLDKKDPAAKRVAVIREPEEQKVSNAMNMVRAVHTERKRKERQAMLERVKKHRQQLDAIDEKRTQKQREIKKVVFRKKTQLAKKGKKV